MDIQDQTKLATPSGHERVHICHSCGWPFPNSHPSSKHRKAHKRICGTIEGYTTKLTHSQLVASDDDDDQHHSDENEKTPSPKIEKLTVKESGSGSGGIYERSNKSEEDIFSDAVTEFSDTGVSPGVEHRSKDPIKLLDSSIEVHEVDDNFEVSETTHAHTKDADKTEEHLPNTLHNSADTQVKLPDSVTKPTVLLVEDKDVSHNDKSVDLVEPPNTVQTKTDSAEAVYGDTVEVSDNKDKEEAVYVLSVPSDIPLVDRAETMINDFKDPKTIYSNVPHDGRDAKIISMVDSFNVKTAEVNIQESEASDNGESSMKSALSEPRDTDFSASDPPVIEETKAAETQHLEMSKTVLQSTNNISEAEISHDKHSVVTLGEKMELEGDSEETNREMFETDHIHTQEVIKNTGSVPVLTEAYTQEIVKEHQIGIEAKQNIVESVVADSEDRNKLGMPESSEKLILEKAEESRDASGVVSEALVDERDGKLMTSQDFCVDASVDSSSRNSLEGNWGSVSVLSTASFDAENAHTGVKSEITADKRRLGKSDAFEGSSLMEPKEEIIDQKASEMKLGTVQNSQPLESEANVSTETEGRKRNEAIAKVKNWSTSENTTALKNLVSEAKPSNPKQLSTMIEKDEAAEKMSELGKSNLVNQESSPPKYIGEGKKVRKKGIASWVPFGCCSSVNVN
uniref:uncharacterized protein LOC122603896 n=1 Tax=Erigeron canadensis TaxID=72917 RepID=UPI001CB8DC14|nr:uncharacterized protein LOC122603896 [Erigeron canadensis]